MVNVMYQDSNDDALNFLVRYISSPPAGKITTFLYVQTKTVMVLSQFGQATKQAPRADLALQYVTRNSLQVNNAIAARLGICVQLVLKCRYADGSSLVHFTNDDKPDSHFYETTDTALKVHQLTESKRARILQYLTSTTCLTKLDGMVDIGRELMPDNSSLTGTRNGPVRGDPSPQICMTTPGTSTPIDYRRFTKTMLNTKPTT